MASNTLLTPSLISKETLPYLENNLVAASKVNRQFENQFVKIGSTLTVRKPNKFRVRTGPALSIQNITEPQTSITINLQRGVDLQFSSQDLSLTIEEFGERYIKPAMAELANQLDYDVIGNWTSVFNEVGTPGTLPSNFATSVQLVGRRMDEGAMPQEDRCLLMNPAAYWNVANGLSSLYVQTVAEPALKGFLARIGNISIYEDQNVQTQTVGAFAGTGVVNGANQTGSSLITNGWTANVTGLFAVGDVINLANVNSINPRSRVSTGVLQDFVITAAANSDGGGNATLQIYPAITPAGAGLGNPYQTVTASPANLAAITVKGSASTAYAQNLFFTRDAFGLVTVPMEVPQGVDFAASAKYRGIAIRIVRAFDINNDVFPCRLDLLYGTATYYPEMAGRLTN